MVRLHLQPTWKHHFLTKHVCQNPIIGVSFSNYGVLTYIVHVHVENKNTSLEYMFMSRCTKLKSNPYSLNIVPSRPFTTVKISHSYIQSFTTCTRLYIHVHVLHVSKKFISQCFAVEFKCIWNVTF